MYDPSSLHHLPEIEDPEIDHLTEGWLHKVLVFFHLADGWLAWQVAFVGLLVSAFAASIWSLVLHSPRLTAGIFGLQLALFGLDALLFQLLPRLNLSFGPWKPQLAVLTVPRLLITLLFVVVALQTNHRPGFALLLAVQGLATAALVYATTVEPFQVGVTEFLAFTDRLPVGVPAIDILHITDLHLERWTKRETAVLQTIAELSPDIIVISGDYVNTSYNTDPITHSQVHDFLSQLEAPYGVYACLGSPPVDLRWEIAPIFADLNIKLMRHEWEYVDMGNGRQLSILGMDCTHHLPTDQARLARLVSSAPRNVPQLLLYHSPELMPQASEWGVDLYLCGHTHGGQVRLPGIGPLLTSSQLGRQYVMGLYKEARTHLYITRGLGLEGTSAPRVRFMCPPELTLVTLMPCGTPVG